MKKNSKIILLAGAAMLALLQTSSSRAQQIDESTESAESSQSAVIEQITQNIKQAIDETEKTKPTVKKKAIVGKIVSIDNQILQVKTRSETKKTTISEDAQIFLISATKPRQTISSDELSVNQSAIVMGYEDSQDFQAHRILVSEELPQSKKRTLISGQLVELDINSSKLTLEKNSQTTTYAFTSKTQVLVRGVGTSSIESLQLKDRIMLIAEQDEETTANAKAIFSIPTSELIPTSLQ